VLDPHPRAMQATREAVRGMRDDPGIDPNVRRVLGIAHDRLTRELQAKVPGIRQLDSQYAELGAQERAVQPASQGRRLFQTEEPGVVRPMQLQEIMDEAARPKGANVGQSLEPTRLREAARAELDRIVGTNRNDLLKLESVLGQPQDWNAQKLAIMFGQDRADRLMDVLARERNFRNSFQKIVEGSQTDMRAAARAAQDANKGNFPLEATLWGTTLRGLQAGWRGLNARAAQMGRDRIAGMMAEQNPVRIQDLVDQMLAAQPTRDVRQEITRRLVDRGLMATVPAAARVAPKKRNER
jgi:hypothetical protein